MKSICPGKEFDHLAQYVLDEGKQYVLWGAANIGHEIYSIYHDKINIVGVVDSDTEKWGQKLGNCVISSPDSLKFSDGRMVLVTTSTLDAVHGVLEQRGFRKNEGYIDYMQFAELFELYKNDFLISERLDISLTERCNLNCRKCNMFMPYFKEPKDQSINAVKSDIDQYFGVVDFVYSLNLLGGEPMLYEGLGEIVEYIGEKYRDRIKRLVIFTNGLLLLDQRLLAKFQKYHVTVQISDYTDVINYRKRYQQLVQCLDANRIAHYTMKTDMWGDFGFPDNPNTICGDDALTAFFDTCRAPFRGLYQSKVYFCHLETSAIRAGLMADNDNDYFDLSIHRADTKKRFFEFDQGYCRDGYISFCEKCRGCECVNDLFVPVAEQCRGGIG